MAIRIFFRTGISANLTFFLSPYCKLEANAFANADQVGFLLNFNQTIIMVPALRKAFNENFSQTQFDAFSKDLNSLHPGAIQFRIAETPEFISKDFGSKIVSAGDAIIDVITNPGFKNLTERAIPVNDRVPNENDHSHFIALDFGICIEEDGSLSPQLIEMQGFPIIPNTWEDMTGRAI